MVAVKKKHKTKREENGFDRLARLIKGESEDIRSEMASGFSNVKHDIAGIKDDIAGILSELKDIKGRLRALEAAVENHAGHSKEMDHALERIAAIEKYLGLKHSHTK